MLAPPKSRRYPLVGTAFDYLMRFYIKKINPNAVTRRWVAFSGAESLHEMEINGDNGTVSYVKTDLGIKADNFVTQAETHYQNYLASSGLFTDELIESALTFHRRKAF